MTGTPRARPGQVKVQYGHTSEGDDFIMAWGDGTAKADANLLMDVLSRKEHSPFDGTWHPSLIDELIRRGYDITTLRISVEKKKED